MTIVCQQLYDNCMSRERHNFCVWNKRMTEKYSHSFISDTKIVFFSWWNERKTRLTVVLSRRGNFSTHLSPSGRIRQVQNTTSCHNSGTMILNSIRVSTVRGHAPYKYPPHNTMPKSPGTNSNPLWISWGDTSFPPPVRDRKLLSFPRLR